MALHKYNTALPFFRQFQAKKQDIAESCENHSLKNRIPGMREKNLENKRQ